MGAERRRLSDFLPAALVAGLIVAGQALGGERKPAGGIVALNSRPTRSPQIGIPPTVRPDNSPKLVPASKTVWENRAGCGLNGDLPPKEETQPNDPLWGKQWMDPNPPEEVPYLGSYYKQMVECGRWAGLYSYLLRQVMEIRADELAVLPHPQLFILDTGVDSLHPDLVGRIDLEASRSFVSGTPVPDNIPPYNDDSYNGHGTHTAGIAGAMPNNNEGIASLLPPGENIIEFKVLDHRGILPGGVLNHALQEVIDFRDEAAANGRPIVPVIDMNLGTINIAFPEGTEKFPEVTKLMQEINNEGGWLVASAGNYKIGMNPKDQSWPASSSWVEGVGGFLIRYNSETDQFEPVLQDQWGYSLGGKVGYNGFSVLSLAKGGGSKRMTGTSMAAPGYAAVLTGLLSAFPEVNPGDMSQILWDTGVPVVDLPGARFANPLIALERLILESGDPSLIHLLGSSPTPTPTVTPNSFSAFMPAVYSSGSR